MLNKNKKLIFFTLFLGGILLISGCWSNDKKSSTGNAVDGEDKSKVTASTPKEEKKDTQPDTTDGKESIIKKTIPLVEEKEKLPDKEQNDGETKKSKGSIAQEEKARTGTTGLGKMGADDTVVETKVIGDATGEDVDIVTEKSPADCEKNSLDIKCWKTHKSRFHNFTLKFPEWWDCESTYDRCAYTSDLDKDIHIYIEVYKNEYANDNYLINYFQDLDIAKTVDKIPTELNYDIAGTKGLLIFSIGKPVIMFNKNGELYYIFGNFDLNKYNAEDIIQSIEIIY